MQVKFVSIIMETILLAYLFNLKINFILEAMLIYIMNVFRFNLADDVTCM